MATLAFNEFMTNLSRKKNAAHWLQKLHIWKPNDLQLDFSRKRPPPGELRKEISQLPYLVNSMQKVKFLFTAIYLYPENLSQISIRSIDSED